MKTLSPSRLDQDTPKWPEVRITLGDQPTVTVSGVITPVDDENTAITRCADQARTLGRPIRARLTTADGAVRRLIVTPEAAITSLDPSAVNSAAGPIPAAKPATTKKKPRRHELLARFPAPLQPVIRWGAPLMGLLVMASVVVMVIHARGSTADAVAPAPTAPIPPAGQLYTEQAPPGWSQNAAWVVDLAEDAPTPVVAAEGAVVAVTARDNSAVPADGDDRYLSVLEPNGQTRWAVPLDTVPKMGPLVLSVDGAPVVMITGTREITYWPLTGGPETVVPLPTSAKITPTGLVTLPNDQLGYLQEGALQTVDALPRTDPGIALDGSVIVTQPDTGAWWTLSADTAPTAVRPTRPAGAVAPERILASADLVLIGWTTATPQDCIAATYQRDDGSLVASVTAPCSALPHAGAAYASNGALAGVGSLIQEGKSMMTVPGLTVAAIVDQIYGTRNGVPVVVATSGETNQLTASTLLPVGQVEGRALVVGAARKLYALEHI